MNYFVADTHFGHQNIIKMTKRPFDGVDNMNKTLIDNWNSVVTNGDNIFIVGDMFFRSGKEDVEKVLQCLKGKKHLIIGNHDESWLTNQIAEKYFVSVDKYLEYNDGHRLLVMSHYPLFIWRKQKKSYMIHGHIHNDTSADFWPCIVARDNLLNAGVEINNYKPVTIEELIDNNRMFKENNMKYTYEEEKKNE